MARFNIENGVASYRINDDVVVGGLNIAAIMGNAEVLQKTVAFALKTLLRNETAGLMKTAEQQAEAAENVEGRIAALNAGKWSEGRAGGEGESTRSLLVQALARVLQKTPAEARDLIQGEINAQLEEQGIDPDTENDDLSDDAKKSKRKIGMAVRKGIGDDPAVKEAMLDIKAEKDKAEREALAKQKAEGKVQSRFA